MRSYRPDLRERLLLDMKTRNFTIFENQNIVKSRAIFYSVMILMCNTQPNPMVTARRDPNDKRRKIFKLTWAGSIYTNHVKAIRKIEEGALKCIRGK